MKCQYLSHMGKDVLNTNVKLSCETRGLKFEPLHMSLQQRDHGDFDIA